MFSKHSQVLDAMKVHMKVHKHLSIDYFPNSFMVLEWLEYVNIYLYNVCNKLIISREYTYIVLEEIYDGFAQDCSNSSALAMELLQFCAKPSIYGSTNHMNTISWQTNYCLFLCLTLFHLGPGPCFTKIFPSQFKFNGNFVSLSSRF